MLQPALRQRLQVTQQCRPEDLARVRERYRNHDIPAELGTYFEDMETRLADCHLFIGRAGASTIAELTAVGRPARSEEHTSELQSLMRSSYAVFCLKNKINQHTN